MKVVLRFWMALLCFGTIACGQSQSMEKRNSTENKKAMGSGKIEVATLGAGCFWCVEAAYMQLNGVESAKSGYSGGQIKNPSYKEVCNGNTGHAEVVQIKFDPAIISFAEILEVFFTVHDPTQLNRQGNDIGTQYRSAVFFHSEEQKQIALKAIEAANETHTWSNPVVTEVTAFESFYPAEDYHDNYYNLHSDQPYCSMVITPKMEKFKKKFHDKLKP
ncbi:MAG: peptide-methionine (S)-S-oxide reductase MsrA [Bacteroidetes bacterium]|nr:peptide-methionine (S)-S-oxide reductase MsrA [Bacteroidota bacterium]